MKGGDRQIFSLKCECAVTRDRLSLTPKQKSKFSLLELDQTEKTLRILPFHPSKQQSSSLSFPIQKLRTIHKKYIEEGKMTL